MDRNENTLLNRLDQPLRFLGINKDEAFTMMGPVVMGFFMGYILSGIVIGIGLLSGFRALKKRNEGAAVIHALYWHMPTTRRSMKLYVPSHIREYIG
ncbi:MAG: type IV conjugative transfer system protein TraL [Alphaproteobacteria bacterium 41-28]|nr:MAG: type IV conjugative transfer system protein TraL [Alphaproteobacteria bacterium 41-28]